MVGNVAGLFYAGTDTTSKAVTTALYLLARDKELQQELQHEADTVDLEAITLQDFYTKLPRLKSFLHEVHRHYGVPVLGLYVTQQIPFCGSFLSPGTDIIVLGRRIALSSQDVPLGPHSSRPQMFDPRRYIVSGVDGIQAVSPSVKQGGFLAFGHGVRSCPGRIYSEALSYTVLVSLLQHFS